MIYRLTDLIKNSINNFLSQELSPEEIEEMRLNEGLSLEDVKQENMVDVIATLVKDENFFHSDTTPLSPVNPKYFPLGVCDFDFRNPWNDD